jgi:hypothetical protein
LDVEPGIKSRRPPAARLAEQYNWDARINPLDIHPLDIHTQINPLPFTPPAQSPPEAADAS